MPTPHHEDFLFARLLSLADALAADFDVFGAADALVHACAEFLPVRDAGLMVENQQSRLQVLASTSQETRILEFLELQGNEGPCLDSFGSGALVEAPDLRHDGYRWPSFSRQALALGFASAYSVPLHIHDKTIGALNLFCTSLNGLDGAEIETAHKLATMATLGILTHRTVSRQDDLSRQLQHALDSRVVIEQAKGIVAERAGASMTAAFEILRSTARSSRRRLVDVAHDVVQGQLPEAGLTRQSVKQWPHPQQ